MQINRVELGLLAAPLLFHSLLNSDTFLRRVQQNRLVQGCPIVSPLI